MLCVISGKQVNKVEYLFLLMFLKYQSYSIVLHYQESKDFVYWVN
jgi:hypothetical protein